VLDRATPGDGSAIAATLKMPRVDEEMRSRPSGLVIEVSGDDNAGVHTVSGDVLTVGRGPLCDVQLGHKSVSEFHFRLTVNDAEQVLLEDLQSSNGVWVGRARVQRAILLPGARFRAGSVQLCLREITASPSAMTLDDDFHGLRGKSEIMRSLFALLRRTAPTPVPVLVSGETGAGKGQLARALHAASQRSGRLVTVDCTALPRDMAEGLLLGHVKGAFTGAIADQPSPFEVADGGTIFLDEIGELPLELQPKLLRVIDEGIVQRLGSTKPRPVDVRVVAATNRNLVEEISVGRFRVDLYHRLAGIAVTIPPLRSRTDDIVFLAELHLESISEKMGQRMTLSAEAKKSLVHNEWSGNVRQLQQTIQRAAYLARRMEITAQDLTQYDDVLALLGEPEATHSADDGEPRQHLGVLVDEFKRDYCRGVLRESATMTIAAATAGYSIRGFQALLRKLDLRAQDYLGES